MSELDPDLETRGGGLSFGLKIRGTDTPRSLGTATSLIMGDKGRVFSISFRRRQLWRDTYSILQKVTQLHKPKSLTISYCKQFFLPAFANIWKT